MMSKDDSKMIVQALNDNSELFKIILTNINETLKSIVVQNYIIEHKLDDIIDHVKKKDND